MTPKPLFFCLLFFTLSLKAQSNWQEFKKLSSPKKTWVLLHPFKAKKALIVSREASRISDSIRASSLLDGDFYGGKVDAFRHAFWMTLLQQEIGKNAAHSLGKAHEKENYQTYKKRKLEDGVVPDQISSEMDLFNNEIGLSLSEKGGKLPKNGLVYRVINTIHQGKLKIIKKDKKDNFLTCAGKVIPEKSLLGKWKNNKCLVNSNYQQ
ncbi:DUF6973 domain-containing protein [Tenacibaculum caenipelagi]|uniref:DUF6973 domain-containing protein n=1 Tax=Tenacibaculum caenipelagi TaxID=1325435 RepID=A0A4R6TEA0_9FLAO|nr:hypothetical protein [Tenacibaculum caenipelagi]TDQ28615.1 hypothetical protein DFQ07_0992 [Tenacibaculum caenipelagi]